MGSSIKIPHRHRSRRWPEDATATRLSALLLILAVMIAALAAPLLAAPTEDQAAADRALEERVQRLSDELRCPTCQGISVKDSEASFSRQIREKVRRMVVEGQSDEDIKAYFVSRYGEWILRAPKKEGVGLVLWLAPGLLLALAGAYIGYRSWRSHQHPADAVAAGGAALTDEQRERIARDLQRFEEEED